jgi:hypothetical protein
VPATHATAPPTPCPSLPSGRHGCAPSPIYALSAGRAPNTGTPPPLVPRYNLVGYGATAFGALASGHALSWVASAYGYSDLQGYRAVFVAYAACGGLLAGLFALLSPKVHTTAASSSRGELAAQAHLRPW